MKGYEYYPETKRYYPVVNQVVTKIQSGAYHLMLDMQNNVTFFEEILPNSNEIIELPGMPVTQILEEVDKFWTSKDQYTNLKLPYKRGFLFHGKPGTGKTTIIKKISDYVIKNDGLVIYINWFNELSAKMLLTFREAEPDRPIAIIFEEIDIMVSSEQAAPDTAMLLNALDGIYNLHNFIFIASTNDLNSIPDSLKKRPSRFDIVQEIAYPTAEDRRAFITSKLDAESLKKIDLDKWISDTEDFGVAHLQELIISVFIYSKKYESVLKVLKAEHKKVGYR